MKVPVYLSFAGMLSMVLCGCSALLSDSARTTVEPTYLVEDGFDRGKANWSAWHNTIDPTAQCDSVVATDFGLPAPSLFLTKFGHCTGSVDILNGLVFTDGVIELDVYLQPEALIDVVFRADYERNTGYIARLDSRDFHDTFVKVDTWTVFGQNIGHTTSPHRWHHMRVEVEESSFRLYCDSQQVAQATDTEFDSGRIALANEVGAAYVDNVTILLTDTAVAATPTIRVMETEGESRLDILTATGLLVIGMCIGCAILLIGILIGSLIRRSNG